MQTVCAYCGVGCKLEYSANKLKGVKNYPVNRGMSCAKGISQIDSMESNRLTEVHIRNSVSGEFAISSYDEAIQKVADAISSAAPERVGFYLSGQMLNEDYYVANKLAKGFVGTPNCDTNSRTCMASAVVGYKKAYGVDYVPVRIEDIDHADLLILIGANPAESHVVLFSRIRAAQRRGLKLIVVDPRYTLSAEYADLHLPVSPGGDIDLLNLIAKRLIDTDYIDRAFILGHTDGFEELKSSLDKLDEFDLLNSSGLESYAVDEFVSLLKNSDKTITAWTMGVNQSIQGTEKNLAIHNLHLLTGQIGKKGSGPLSLTGQPNAMGGREVGGLSTTLAVHLDYTHENCQKVSEFWGCKNLPSDTGLTAHEMLQQADRGELDLLIICHTDPVYHLPNRAFVERAIKKVKLVVEINAYEGSETSRFAHIKLPAVPFGYKEGTQVNMDRTLTRVEALKHKGNILQDWEIFARIGTALGYNKEFGYKSTKEVFDEYKEMTRLSADSHLNIYEADYEKLKEKPFVWGEGLFKDHSFMTQNRKANFHVVENRNLSEQISDEYPFVLLTGRTRDQWHSCTKTGGIERLTRYKPLSFVEISAHDAALLDIKDSDTVSVISKRGKLKTTAKITDINQGVLFMPITDRNINYLTNDLLDPLSKEPDYNHSAVAILKENHL